jgi:hypothetical protein
MASRSGVLPGPFSARCELFLLLPDQVGQRDAVHDAADRVVELFT